MLNKIKGGLFGLAIGDALGCTTEFMHPSDIKKQYGFLTDIIGGGPFKFKPGEVTDDTDMAICVSKGIVSNYKNPIPEIGKEFIKWLESNPKDIGMTVRSSLLYFYETKNWEEASKKTHEYLNGKSAGNGSLMRTLPIALAYNDPYDIARLSRAQSKMTHYDDKASNACVIYNNIAYFLLNGMNLKDAIESQIIGTEYEFVLYEPPYNPPDPYVINTFRWALYILLNYHSFEEVVQVSANQGYDADTLASIVGGLAGIYYGYESIPNNYINILIKKNELDILSKKNYDLRVLHC